MRKIKKTFIFVIVLMFFLALSWSSVPLVYAAPVETVTNLNDSGAGSLRQAIADVDPGGTINITVTGTITLTTGQFIVDKAMTIKGSSAKKLIISGNTSRIFYINNTTASISDMTLQDVNAVNFLGGGVGSFNSNVTLSNVTIRNNTVSGSLAFGGGIFNSIGTMTLIGVTVNNNTAMSSNDISQALGGGIFNDNGTMTLTNVTISNNSTVATGALLGLAWGGGIYNNSIITMTNVTINGNSVSRTSPNGFAGGGGINSVNVITMSNTIVSNNLPEDCFRVPVTTSGYNIDSDNTCNLIDVNDLPGVDPVLGPLQDNGGPTLTHALLEGSPAIDTGNDAGCPATDQRGRTRPKDGDLDGTSTCDIGAFELINIPVPTLNEWGMILFTALAGLGAVYFIRRKRVES